LTLGVHKIPFRVFSSNNPQDAAVHKGRSRAEIPTRAEVSKKPSPATKERDF
jgi:hypothetical protein